MEASLIDNMIWKEAADIIFDLQLAKTPSEKLETIVRAITTISWAYSLLSESGDDVTADDILQLVSYVILKSNAKQLWAQILFVKALSYESESE